MTHAMHTLTCGLRVGPGTVDPPITEQLLPNTLGRVAALAVLHVLAAAELLEGRHHEGEGLGPALPIRHLQPDVHVLVDLLGVDPAHQRRHREVESREPCLVDH